jgi:hypothetical protein
VTGLTWQKSFFVMTYDEAIEVAGVHWTAGLVSLSVIVAWGLRAQAARVKA